MSMNIEVTDSTCSENNQAQLVRYQHNYRLESKNVFKLERVEKLVKTIMNDNLESFSYDSSQCIKMCFDTAAKIRQKIHALKFDRYKFVIIFSIVEKNSQSMYAAMGFLWDYQRDNYITHVFEGRTFSAYCCVFALYYE
ncbi:PREDICTED: tctex1 domain-containing protein 1-like [Ceratosolen solmsi marchali]|uniref:Tctex1 domain-containing protein 1-like n=1 Tax=Ceratosolen solmsi marchali TaxID=326594 RepID=A0AAJ6VLW1_9HYME|nr:PREDICTED: tctex1 domain-containing protein 1-like [Ceratosolen solmsi marchali]